RAGVVRPRSAPGARPGLLHRGGRRPLRAPPRLEAVGEMNRHSLLTKTLLLMLGVFGATTLTMAGFSAWFLNRHLTEEYQSKGTAIARSIADSGAEILVTRDASTVQALIDQFLEIKGVVYVFVVNADGEIVAHTFVPVVPEEIERLRTDPREE